MDLCLNCGDIKFGAICPCPACNVESCGTAEVDILFSDHFHATESLEEAGAVIKAIRNASTDSNESHWAIMQYLSTQFPDILTVRLKDPMLQRVTQLLGSITLPPVTWKISPRLQPPPDSESG